MVQNQNNNTQEIFLMRRINCRSFSSSSTMIILINSIWVYGILLLSLDHNSPIEALNGVRLAYTTTGRSTVNRSPFIPSFSSPASSSSSLFLSLKEYCTTQQQHHRTSRSITRIHSVTIDPKMDLSVSSTDDEEILDENEQQHQLDLHETFHDDTASHSQSSSKPFTTSSYLAAVSPDMHNAKQRKKKRNNNTAMKDVSFLRKRTANLLKVTSSENYLSHQQNDSQSNTISRGMKVNLNTFNFLIDGWAFSGEIDSVDKAMILLGRMEEMHSNYGTESPVRPDVRSYTKVINALSRSNRPDSGDLAEHLLNKMEHVSMNGENPSAKPNTHTYTAAIEAHAYSGNDNSPQKAEELLEQMVEKYHNGDPNVLPNARCFNAAISSYAKSALPGAAQRAENLLERLDELYMSGLEEAKPNSFNYNSLITAWANCREQDHEDDHEFCSALKAQEILERMEQCYASGDRSCKPTTISYNAVIDAYAKSSRVDAAERAEQVLRRMGHLYKEGRSDIRPNTRSFNTVINAWAKSKSGPDYEASEKALDLLDMMTRLYEDGNNDTVRPDVHTYCTVINAFARSQLKHKAERANNLFRTMTDAYKKEETGGKKNNRHLRPNVVAVNAVMNACAYTPDDDIQERNRAMEIAHKRLKVLEDSDYGSPDQITYGTFLKVCANQMPDCNTRQQIIKVIFQKCARNGQVGNLVLQQLKVMGPPELYSHLTGHYIEDNIQMEDLREELWCNVVEGKRRRRRHVDNRKGK